MPPALEAVPPSVVSMIALPPGSTPLPAADQPGPHIALLLPLKYPAFAQAADAVKQGFLTAAGKQVRSWPVRVYASSDDTRDIITLYRQALANGAVAVAGPLTRNGVAIMAGYPDIAVPTLALNTSEARSTSDKLFFYSLTAETEARQAAQLAFKAQYRDATIISSGTALSKRLAAAFADEWKSMGGNITADVQYSNNLASLADLPVAPWPPGVQPPPPLMVLNADGELVPPKRPLPPPVAPSNVAFLAVDSAQARMLRPYLNPSLPVYATSQLFNGSHDTLTNYDLNDIRFVDMPWLLQPEHPLVTRFAHAGPQLSADLERLYALGVDAYRLVQVLLQQSQAKALPLDGVTGRISLKDANTFQRESVAAQFKYGRGLTPEALNALNASKAADKAAETAARKATAGSRTSTPAQ
jgi:outer membrane PBP1 activator LpoA protein